MYKVNAYYRCGSPFTLGTIVINRDTLRPFEWKFNLHTNIHKSETLDKNNWQ